MVIAHLTDANLKLARVALATGAVAHPMRTKLNLKS